MAWETVNSEIDKIKHIVESWEKTGSLNILEQDMVLEKLRLIYDKIKFAGFGLQEEMPAPAAEAEQKPDDVIANVVAERQPQPAVTQINNQEPEIKEKIPAAENPERRESLEDLIFQVKPKRDRKTILSLYDDGPVEQCASGNGDDGFVGHEDEIAGNNAGEQSQVSSQGLIDDVSADADLGDDVLNAMGLGAERKPETTADNNEPVAAVSSNVRPEGSSNGQKKVLGEILSHGETLSDVYARNNHQQDVAGKIMNGKVNSIRTSIGINDKFLLIRDLFGGDVDLYDRTIRELDSFADLDDAVIYIHDNFRWNPDSDGAKLLMDLLMRKLA